MHDVISPARTRERLLYFCSERYGFSLSVFLISDIKPLHVQVGGRIYILLKKREREKDQRNRPNLKTPAIMLWRIQPGNRIDGGEDGTRELPWQTVSYPPLQRGKIFLFPGFSPSFTGGLINTRETFILAQIKNRFWSSPQCLIFP